MPSGADIVDDVRARLAAPIDPASPAARRFDSAMADLADAVATGQHISTRETAWRIAEAANTARHEAIAELAAAEGAPIGELWWTERDACVHCSALAGEVIEPGEAFDASATFGRRPLPTFGGTLERPPRHPHCRCRIVPHRPEWGNARPDALRREARRSVARGFATATEPNSVRLDAARRLLARLPDEGPTALPKSVRRTAERQIREGTVAREVPGTDPASRRRYSAARRSRFVTRARRVGIDRAMLELGYPETVAQATEWMAAT